MTAACDRSLTTAALASAFGRHVTTLKGVSPVWGSAVVHGPAFTARGVGGDNLVLHWAVNKAPPGTVLVVDVRGDCTVGHWGDLLSRAALANKLAGLVIRGSVRDVAEVKRLGFPVFASGSCPTQATKSIEGQLNCVLDWDGVEVPPDSFVVGDADGVVVIPARLLVAARTAVAELESREEEIRKGIVERGASTIELLDLRPPP